MRDNIITQVVSEPALAVTGVNNEEDFVWVLIQLAICAFFYFLVAPVSEKDLFLIIFLCGVYLDN